MPSSEPTEVSHEPSFGGAVVAGIYRCSRRSACVDTFTSQPPHHLELASGTAWLRKPSACPVPPLGQGRVGV